MTKRFHLTITETVANETYAEEISKFRANNSYGGYAPPANEPQPDRVIKVLDVTVTETEFAAIKKAALETMA